MHIVLVKVAYRVGNKQVVTLQILNHNRQLESLCKINLHIDGFKNQHVKLKTIGSEPLIFNCLFDIQNSKFICDFRIFNRSYEILL